VGTVTWRIQTLKRKTDAPTRVGSGDFHEKAVKGEFLFTLFFLCRMSADSKAGKDRVTILPDKLRERLQQHLAAVRRLHDRDLVEGYWGRFRLG
jgi:hypothetical protein